MAFDAEQMTNARLIMAVGNEMGMSQRDILIALMTAMQESGLRNLRAGMGDSAGLFQQRPSTGWGSYSQVTNPMYAARKFFSALRGVKSRNSMSLSGAAQAVQQSAFPDAYARWEADARRLMGSMGSSVGLPFPLQPPPGGMDASFYTTNTPGIEGASMPGLGSAIEDKTVPGAPGAGASINQPNAPQTAPQIDPQDLKDFPSVTGLSPIAPGGGVRSKILQEGLKWLGTPYSWGGGSLSGPSYGIAQGAGTRGFDCSGLVMYLYNKFGVHMPRIVPDQAQAAIAQGGHRASLDSLVPGDFVVENNGNHIGIYAGNGQILEAPHTGDVVKLAKIDSYWRSNFYGIHLNIPGDGGGGQLMELPTPGDTQNMQDMQNMMSAPQGGQLLNFPGL